RALWAEFYGELPEPIQEELHRDPGFAESLGVIFQKRVQVGGREFDLNAFWAAAAEARNGRVANIRPLGTTSDVTFNPYHVGDQKGISFDDPQSGETKTLYLPEF